MIYIYFGEKIQARKEMDEEICNLILLDRNKWSFWAIGIALENKLGKNQKQISKA